MILLMVKVLSARTQDKDLCPLAPNITYSSGNPFQHAVACIRKCCVWALKITRWVQVIFYIPLRWWRKCDSLVEKQARPRTKDLPRVMYISSSHPSSIQTRAILLHRSQHLNLQGTSHHLPSTLHRRVSLSVFFSNFHPEANFEITLNERMNEGTNERVNEWMWQQNGSRSFPNNKTRTLTHTHHHPLTIRQTDNYAHKQGVSYKYSTSFLLMEGWGARHHRWESHPEVAVRSRICTLGYSGKATRESE